MEPLNPSGHRQRQVTLNSSSHMQLRLITHRNKLCATTHSHSTTTATSNHPRPLNPSSHGEPRATTPYAATGNHKQSLTASSHENRWQPLEPHSFDDPAHDDSCLMFSVKVGTFGHHRRWRAKTSRVSSAPPLKSYWTASAHNRSRTRDSHAVGPPLCQGHRFRTFVLF